MTPEALAAIKDKEILVLRLIGGGTKSDIYLGGVAVFPDGDQVASFYVAHPSVRARFCLTIEDKDNYEFWASGKTLEEGFSNDPEFRSYWEFAQRTLDIDKDSPASGYILLSVAIAFSQAAHCKALDPNWFAEKGNIPLYYLEDVIALAERTDDCVRSFCEQYVGAVQNRVLN